MLQAWQSLCLRHREYLDNHYCDIIPAFTGITEVGNLPDDMQTNLRSGKMRNVAEHLLQPHLPEELPSLIAGFKNTVTHEENDIILPLY